MPRVYSDIRNFKQLEATFRETANSIGKAIQKIEQAQKRKQSDPDREALANAHEAWSKIHDSAKHALADFWDDVERKN